MKASPGTPDFLSSTPEEIGAALEAFGEPSFRGGQIFEWIQRRGVVDPDAMTNLPRSLRERLKEISLAWPAAIGEVLRSADGTRKLEVRLRDGSSVETVLIPEEGKLTQCVSTQVGCAVRCAFCRSGHLGLSRNLDAAEIIAEVQLGRAFHGEGESLRNIVFMGVGEPLHNLEAVLQSIRVLSHGKGLDLSTRRITLSTAGVVKGIDELGRETGGQIALAVSLHAADPGTRARLVPGLKETPEDIAEALSRYPLPARRRFTIEYVLIKGVNDSDADARALVRLLSSLRVKVNLLPLNTHDATSLEPPSEERVLTFQRVLTDKGLTAILRRRRGGDVCAACGQLLAVRRPR